MCGGVLVGVDDNNRGNNGLIMIISHESPEYITKWNAMHPEGRNNGAYYYSKEIVKNIIPRIKTDYNWTTINIGKSMDHSIVFIHYNFNPLENYAYLLPYNDLILVCGLESTAKEMRKKFKKVIYLPLSVDVEEVARHRRTSHWREYAFCGRYSKVEPYRDRLHDGTKIICGKDRPEMLDEMSKYKYIYGVGRVALEAKILGCEVLPYDDRFPDPSIWKVLDNKDAAEILQKELDKITKGRKHETQENN